MEQREVLAGLEQEMRRGTIVLCVLARAKTPQYGYNLVADLQQRGMPVEANTLYPLLRRLESQGLLQSSWETGEGKPRKYYAATDFGNQVYDALLAQWKQIANSVQSITEEPV